MSEAFKAWLWLVACAGFWLALSVSAAEADWSCEVMFGASLVAFILLQFVSRNWISEKATKTADGGSSLFGKLALVSLPFVILSVIARWKFDGELADWTVGQVLWTQGFAADLHAERRWGYLVSGVSLGFAMAIIYFAATRRFEAIDHATTTQKKISSILGAISALIMALATFSIVAGPASAAISHMSERRASGVLAQVSKAIQQHELAWRVLVGRYLASALEDEPVSEKLSIDDLPTEGDCAAQDPADTDCSIGAYLEDVFAKEGSERLSPSEFGDVPPDGSPSGSNDFGPFAKGLYAAAQPYLSMHRPGYVEHTVPLSSVSELSAGGIIEATAELCKRVACEPDGKGAVSKVVGGSADVTKTRLGKVLSAVFDAILPIAGVSVPAPKLSETKARAFQDVVDAVTKDPLKARIRDLSTRGMHFLVKHCMGAESCDFEGPLENEVRISAHETPGWKGRLITALRQRWSAIKPLPVLDPAGGIDVIDENQAADGSLCECVTKRNGVVVGTRTGLCENLRLTCR